MKPRLAAILERDRTLLLDTFVARLLDRVPGYGRLPTDEVRRAASEVLDALVDALDGDPRAAAWAAEHGRRRAGSGILAIDLLRASLVGIPVLREHLRRQPESESPAFRDAVDDLLDRVAELAAATTSAFVDETTRRIDGKNRALARMNEELERSRSTLTREAEVARNAAAAATTFAEKVIESLSSGVIAIDVDGQRVRLYSDAAERMLELPTEEVLGRPVAEAFASLGGLDVRAMVDTVLGTGRLPLTRVELRLPSGRRRYVFVSASRIYDPAGEPDGTVVVIEDVSERELLLDTLSRYVSREVLRRVMARGAAELPHERRVCTILFADIRGFTGLAEALAPEALHELVNAAFKEMIAAVTAEGGFVDKFVGDKVMALFGADTEAQVGARAALRAAITMKRGLARLNDERAALGQAPVLVGVGVNTGEVVLGPVGGTDRLNFTAIGDAVNVADRLQGAARLGEIRVGGATAALVGDGFPLSGPSSLPVRGRVAEVEAWVLEWEAAPPTAG